MYISVYVIHFPLQAYQMAFSLSKSSKARCLAVTLVTELQWVPEILFSR